MEAAVLGKSSLDVGLMTAVFLDAVENVDSLVVTEAVV